MQNSGKHLTNLGNLCPGKFEFPQSRLKMLEAFGVIDAHFHLRWMTQVSPSLLSHRGGPREPASARSSDIRLPIEAEM
jgi:hypothetical protein